MSDFNQPVSGNDLARFAGLQTFMRLPDAPTPEGLDVGFIGVPMDIGTSWRSGTRFGPKQLRQGPSPDPARRPFLASPPFCIFI